MNSQWDYSFDFVSIGSGGGGLCGALTATAHGGRALVVEKQPLVGGTTAISGGILWIPNNPLMREEGIPDSFEEALTYLEDVVGDAGPATSLERKERYLRAGPEMVDFLRGQGIRFVRSAGFSDYHDTRPGGNAAGRGIECELFNLRELGPWRGRIAERRGFRGRLAVQTKDGAKLTLMGRTRAGALLTARVIARTYLARARRQDLAGAGRALVGRMLQACLQRGVEVWTGTPLMELVEEDGRVTGVVVRREGRDVRIEARRGVLIAAGGFAKNDAMRREYGVGGPVSSAAWSSVHPGDTGEAIEIAQHRGAATDLMEEAYWIPTTITPDGRPNFFVGERAKPHIIIVDQTGQRYANEAADYRTAIQAMYRRHETVPAAPSWAILDARHRRRYVWGTTPPGYMPRSWLKHGFVVRARTIEELARLCEIDPANLRATVDRYNRMAEAGVDEDFHKGESEHDRNFGDPRAEPNPCIGTIEVSPYYAVKVYPGDAGTGGGLLTDADARVLREDGTPFEGLYATGNSTATVMGRCYPGPGSTIGPAFVWSYVAALHAMGRGA